MKLIFIVVERLEIELHVTMRQLLLSSFATCIFWCHECLLQRLFRAKRSLIFRSRPGMTSTKCSECGPHIKQCTKAQKNQEVLSKDEIPWYVRSRRSFTLLCTKDLLRWSAALQHVRYNTRRSHLTDSIGCNTLHMFDLEKALLCSQEIFERPTALMLYWHTDKNEPNPEESYSNTYKPLELKINSG